MRIIYSLCYINILINNNIGINNILTLLTIIIMPIIKEISKYKRLIEIITGIFIIIFNTTNILIFYICFEIILIPLYILIIKEGYKYRKYETGYRLIIYSIIGSIGLLIIIIYITINIMSYNISYIEYRLTKIEIIREIWILFIIPFIIKLPTFPFYIWLPIVHGDSPTEGSMILAGLVIKLGGYGILIYNILILKAINIRYILIIYIIITISIITSSYSILRTIDIKKIIAYSSIIHMNIGIYSIYNNNIYGIIGNILQIISHGLISTGLFFIIGILYKRYKTKSLYLYSGLYHSMPLYSIIFITYIIINMNFPYTSGFISELIIYYSISINNVLIYIIIIISTLIFTSIMLWFSNIILFGPISPYIYKYTDISYNELLITIILLIYILFIGIFPNYIIDIIYEQSLNIIY